MWAVILDIDCHCTHVLFARLGTSQFVMESCSHTVPHMQGSTAASCHDAPTTICVSQSVDLRSRLGHSSRLRRSSEPRKRLGSANHVILDELLAQVAIAKCFGIHHHPCLQYYLSVTRVGMRPVLMILSDHHCRD